MNSTPNTIVNYNVEAGITNVEQTNETIPEEFPDPTETGGASCGIMEECGKAMMSCCEAFLSSCDAIFSGLGSIDCDCDCDF